MCNPDYYPMGAYNDPNAPFNEPTDPDPIEVECKVSVTLQKAVIVETDNYSIDYDEESGNYDIDLHDSYNELAEKAGEQHYSIPDLLAELARYIKNDIAAPAIPDSHKNTLRKMLADAEGWELDCVEVDDYKI